MSCENDVVSSVMEVFVRIDECKKHMTLLMLNQVIIKLKLYSVSRLNLLRVLLLCTDYLILA